MGIMKHAQNQTQKITSDLRGAAVPITFIAPDGTTVTVNGIHTKHHLGIDTEGNVVNSKKPYVSVSEANLTAQNYPVRNSDNEVAFEEDDNGVGHLVQAIDSTGTLCTYKIESWLPDETFGLIVIFLTSYTA